MKKGDIHVDWVISLGIFILYITSLLLIIKPGFRPSYSGDSLINILEEKFRKEAYWTIKTFPVSLSNCIPDDTTGILLINISAVNWDGLDNTFSDPSGGVFWPVFSSGSDAEALPDFNFNSISGSCDYSFGSVIDINGINESSLIELRDKGQDSINFKKYWNYPVEKGFAIYVMDGTTYKIGMTEPKSENLYVKKWKDWIVYSNGTRKDVEVIIEAW